MSAQTWLLFLPAAFLMSMAPGPNNLLGLSNGLRFGVTRAMIAVTGRLVAFLLMIGLTAVGLGAVLATSELVFQVIKWGGVLYLLFLGIQIWLAPPMDLSGPGGGKGDSLLALAKREFWIAAGNPKAILIFTAVFPQFVTPDAAYIPQFLMLGAGFLATEVVAALAYVAAGRGVGLLNLGLRGRIWLNRITGGAFIGAAALLAAARR
ncbi:LysE family translocator [Lacibacterium aquatile]|uniref:LysE family translocator n=1 Tax=Lacibacterium aquatile TaxID=1168082 RepID=A0ABW5DSR7_9PROT